MVFATTDEKTIQPKAFNKYWPLLLIVVSFTVVKLPHLSHPHFWDEAWSYATAVQLMYEQGPTLLPGTIDVEATRGHPLFYYLAASSWMKIFGDSLVSKHLFALFFSLLLLIAAYLACVKLYNVRVATLATVLFAAQILFFVHSSMLLPEVMVALFFFTSIYFFVTEKYMALALSLSLLYLSKESGLVAGIVLGVAFVFMLFQKEYSKRDRMKMFLALLIPGLIIVSFYVYQKLHYGWFFFPEHIGLIDAKLNDFPAKFQAILFVIFIEENRQWLWMMVVALSVFYSIMKRNYHWLLFIVIIALIFVFKYATHLGFLKNPTFNIAFIIFSLIVCIRYWRQNSRIEHHKQFLVMAAVFSLAYLVFSTVNFYTTRYLIIIILFSLIAFSVWIDVIIKQLSIKFYFPVAIFILALFIPPYLKKHESGDTALGAYTTLALQKDIIDYLLNSKAQQSQIGTGSFLQRINLQNASCGFINNKAETFQHVDWDINGATDYAVFDNIEPDSRYDAIKADTNFILVHEVTKENLWGAVFKRKGVE